MTTARIVDDIGALLVAQEFGILEESIFLEYMPESPDDLIYVHVTGGIPDDDIPTRTPTFQVIVRSTVLETALDLAEQIYAFLTAISNVEIGSHYAYYCKADALPQSLGQDAKGRSRYVVNFHIHVRTLAAWSITYTNDHAALRHLDYGSSRHTGFVGLADNQEISGLKIFAQLPLLPSDDPTEDRQAATKAYVDAHGGGASALNDLTDVTISDVKLYDVLYYTGDQWVNVNFPLHILAPEDGDVFQYVAGSGVYMNRSLAEAGISAIGHTHVEADISDLSHDAVALQGNDVAADAPSEGDVLTWNSGEGEWTPAAPTGGGGGSQQILLCAFIPGELAVETKVNGIRLFAPCAMEVDEVHIAADDDAPPTGADVILDINKDGTTIFTTQGNRPTITAGGNSGTSGTPDVTAAAKNAVFTIDIDQIGSTYPGQDLTIQIRGTAT